MMLHNLYSHKLSTLDSVVSTTTHFILNKYKHDGIVFEPDNKTNELWCLHNERNEKNVLI